MPLPDHDELRRSIDLGDQDQFFVEKQPSGLPDIEELRANLLQEGILPSDRFTPTQRSFSEAGWPIFAGPPVESAELPISPPTGPVETAIKAGIEKAGVFLDPSERLWERYPAFDLGLRDFKGPIEQSRMARAFMRAIPIVNKFEAELWEPLPPVSQLKGMARKIDAAAQDVIGGLGGVVATAPLFMAKAAKLIGGGTKARRFLSSALGWLGYKFAAHPVEMARDPVRQVPTALAEGGLFHIMGSIPGKLGYPAMYLMGHTLSKVGRGQTQSVAELTTPDIESVVEGLAFSVLHGMNRARTMRRVIERFHERLGMSKKEMRGEINEKLSDADFIIAVTNRYNAAKDAAEQALEQIGAGFRGVRPISVPEEVPPEAPERPVEPARVEEPPPVAEVREEPPVRAEPPTERPPEIPTMVQRIEERGVEPGRTDKPQGLYTSPAGIKTHHEFLGGERVERETNPQANVLRLDATESVRTNRGNYMGQSAGVAALRHLLGIKEAQRFLDLPKKQAREEASRRFPDVEWSRYYDTQEIAEGMAGMLAREAGYDAIWGFDRTNAAYNEYVALNERAFLPKAERPPEIPVEKEIPPEPPPRPVERAVEPREAPEALNPSAMTDTELLERYQRPGFAKDILQAEIQRRGLPLPPRRPAAVPEAEAERPIETMPEGEGDLYNVFVGVRGQRGGTSLKEIERFEIVRTGKRSAEEVAEYLRAKGVEVQGIEPRPEPERPAEAPPAKEPWEMTRGAFSEEILRKDPLQRVNMPEWRDAHKTAVENAIKRGLPVPPEVLADYPDLKEKYVIYEGEPTEKPPLAPEPPREEPVEVRPKAEPAPADRARLTQLRVEIEDIQKQIAEFEKRYQEAWSKADAAKTALKKVRIGTKREDQLRKKYEKLQAVADQIWREQQAFIEPLVAKQLEYGELQGENPIFRIVATHRRARTTAETPEQVEAVAQRDQAVRQDVLRELEQYRQQALDRADGKEALSAEDDAAVVQASLEETASEFMLSPLKAETPDKIVDSLRGSIRRRRLIRRRQTAEQEVESIVDVETEEAVWDRDKLISQIAQSYDFDAIDKYVEQARELVEKHRTAIEKEQAGQRELVIPLTPDQRGLLDEIPKPVVDAWRTKADRMTVDTEDPLISVRRFTEKQTETSKKLGLIEEDGVTPTEKGRRLFGAIERDVTFRESNYYAPLVGDEIPKPRSAVKIGIDVAKHDPRAGLTKLVETDGWITDGKIALRVSKPDAARILQEARKLEVKYQDATPPNMDMVLPDPKAGYVIDRSPVAAKLGIRDPRTRNEIVGIVFQDAAGQNYTVSASLWADFIGNIPKDAEIRGTKPSSPIFAVKGKEVVGVLMPLKISEEVLELGDLPVLDRATGEQTRTVNFLPLEERAVEQPVAPARELEPSEAAPAEARPPEAQATEAVTMARSIRDFWQRKPPYKITSRGTVVKTKEGEQFQTHTQTNEQRRQTTIEIAEKVLRGETLTEKEQKRFDQAWRNLPKEERQEPEIRSIEVDEQRLGSGPHTAGFEQALIRRGMSQERSRQQTQRDADKQNVQMRDRPSDVGVSRFFLTVASIARRWLSPSQNSVVDWAIERRLAEQRRIEEELLKARQRGKIFQRHKIDLYELENELTGIPRDVALKRLEKMDLPEDVKTAIQEHMDLTERDRQALIESYREDTRRYLAGLTRREMADVAGEDVFRALFGERAVKDISRAEMIEELTHQLTPDDWGIQGLYLHHMHRGQYRILTRDADGDFTAYHGRAETEAQALIEAGRVMVRENVDEVRIEWDMNFLGDPATRLSRKQYGALLTNLRKSLEEESGVTMERGNVQQAVRGIVGTKAAKKKWLGLVLKRKGAPGYSRDYVRAIGYQIAATERHLSLSAINRQLQPIIETLQSAGQRHLAEYFQSALDYWWGTPTNVSRAIDTTLHRIPYLGKLLRPLWLERNAGRILAFNSLRRLGWSPRFAIINSFQPFQTVWPIVGTRTLLYAAYKMRTPEGRALLHEAGIDSEMIKTAESLWRTGKPGTVKMPALMITERHNLRWSFTAGYWHGRKAGMSHEEAISYGRQIMRFTQFNDTLVTMAPIFRHPLARVLFQYKNFTARFLELAADHFKSKDPARIARFIAAQFVVGGVRGITKPLTLLGLGALYKFRTGDEQDDAVRSGFISEKNWKAIRDKYGPEVADGLRYGIGGLIGLDLTQSFSVLDTPYGSTFYDKFGNFTLGPTVGDAVAVGKLMLEWRKVPKTGDFVHGYLPVLTELASRMFTLPIQPRQAAWMLKGKKGIPTIRGDLAVKLGDIATSRFAPPVEARKLIGGFRTVEESVAWGLVRMRTEIGEERSARLDAACRAYLNGNKDAIVGFQGQWNNLYPMYPISDEDVTRKLEDLYKRQQMSIIERERERSPELMQEVLPR